jgi:hypothetical protein
MPEPGSRPPCAIEPDLAASPICWLVEDRVTVGLQCDNCHHKGEWSPDYMARELKRWLTRPLAEIGGQIRCTRCKSNWMHVWRTLSEPDAGPEA